MAINDKVYDLTALFRNQKPPENRIIISPHGNALTPVSPFFASQVLDLSMRNIQDGEERPCKTSSSNECYIVYFEPEGTSKDDWSHTQIALIEDRPISGLHLAFIELTSSDGHEPNTLDTQGKSFFAYATVAPPSNILQEILYPIHYRNFDKDGFFDLSRSQISRNQFMEQINECSGKIPLTRPQELASDSMQYQGEFSVTRGALKEIKKIQDKVTAQSASDRLRKIALHGSSLS